MAALMSPGGADGVSPRTPRGVSDGEAGVTVPDTRESGAGVKLTTFDLASATVRALNAELHAPTAQAY